MKSRWQWLWEERGAVFFLALLAGVLRIIFLKFDNMPSDAAGHIAYALRIADDAGLMVNYDGNCSTLHKYAIFPFMAIARDPIFGARIFTLIFGVSLILPYYATIKLLFDRRVAIFSTLLLVFYPLHIVQSSTVSSDAVYYFFIWCSFYYFFAYAYSKSDSRNLWISSVFFNIAALLRFESWIFIPFLFLLSSYKGLRRASIFFGLCMLGPFFCVTLNAIIHQDPFYSFNAAAHTAFAEITQGRIPSYDPRFWGWFHVLWRTAGPVLVIGGLAGIGLAILSRRKWELAVFLGVMFSALTLNSYAARAWHHERYSIPLVFWLIPYAVFFFERVSGLWKYRQATFFAFCIFLPLLSFCHMPFSAMPNMLRLTPPEINELGIWLKKNIKANENVIIDADPFNTFTANIMLRTGIPPQRCLTLKNPVFGKNAFENQKDFVNYLQNTRPRYLVLSAEGQLQQKFLKFALKQKSVRLDGVFFEVMLTKDIRQWGRYVIYKITYE